ncbi:beta-galactoside alpha-2,6-sialyltransferase 1-like [Ptychodera flava]|uniref:beta-galactoside alpha-2,6-sialyltransferase 1-like n=1 Tax=Ptychodera flava TaxID=63121 RepID=UPI003969DBC5
MAKRIGGIQLIRYGFAFSLVCGFAVWFILYTQYFSNIQDHTTVMVRVFGQEKGDNRQADSNVTRAAFRNYPTPEIQIANHSKYDDKDDNDTNINDDTIYADVISYLFNGNSTTLITSNDTSHSFDKERSHPSVGQHPTFPPRNHSRKIPGTNIITNTSYASNRSNGSNSISVIGQLRSRILMKARAKKSFPLLPNLSSPDIKALLKLYEAGFDDTRISRSNVWGVPKRKSRNGSKKIDESVTGEKLVCRVQRQAMIETLGTNTTPFKEMGLAKYFPKLDYLDTYQIPFNRCAVVGSSRYLINFTMGAEIDKHDAILRMNAAPVKGFEDMVGRKTTFHLLNSQLLERRMFHEITDTYSGEVTYLVWKGGPYSGNLVRWYEKVATKKFFNGYIEWGKMNPNLTMHIINPKSLWNAWDVIQDYCHQYSSDNPLSSGFTAIQVMLPICNELDVYGMVYPKFNSSSCHYYDKKHCNSLNWHPIAKEKCFINKLNIGAQKDIYEKARISIPGFATLNCDENV